MDKKIENILNLYENILSKKPITSEADIKGVDELVYNPVTGQGGKVGYGYDGGNRKENLKWPGHDNHLHIGFTDKEVAMKIIDKADKMGLKTTENPYAKKDPNGKVDNVHSNSSLHYKNFPGIPLVGMAVDISGDNNKITELIKWIDQNFAGVSSSSISSEVPSSISTTDIEIKDPLLYQIGKNIGQVLFPKTMSESISFGKNVKKDYGSIIIPKESNKNIKSPISGIVNNTRYSSGCKNQITIKTNDTDSKYLEFCGISNPNVKDGDTIIEGQLLGQTEDDVAVTLFNSSFKRIPLDRYTKITNNNEKPDYKDEPKKNNSTKRYKDPVLAALAQIPFKPFENQYDESGKMKEKRIGLSTDKRPVDPWILNLVKKPFQTKVNENVERIKKLL